MSKSKDYALEEWKTTMENARHFNDLLIRFRMLGLPMVITLAVAGIVFSNIIEEISLWVWAIPLMAFVIASLLSIVFIMHTIQQSKQARSGDNKQRKEFEEKQKPPIPFYWVETIIWGLFIILVWGFSIGNIVSLVKDGIGFGLNNVFDFAPVAITVFPAVVLLLALYFMDRFYYYKLLLGAVSRLVVLEKILDFKVTTTTSKYIPGNYATNLVTAFYGLPGLLLITICCVGYTN